MQRRPRDPWCWSDSFGGMTISAAAEAAPLDVTQLVYVAAYVPESGESMETLALSDGENSFTEESFVIAPDYSYAEILERDRAAILATKAPKINARQLWPD